MKAVDHIQKKIFERAELSARAASWKKEGRKIVFTNGCFDILHKGHLEILTASASFGDILIVGLNTDASVKRLKGDHRPINDENFRSWMMASLELVDAVSLFEEDTPLELIRTIQPDILVKGGDYTIPQIVGAEDVIRSGGIVKIVPLVKGYSTSSLIEAIQKL